MNIIEVIRQFELSYFVILIHIRSFLEEPVENKLMITNGVSSSSGLKLLFLGIKIGRPRLFFSSDPTTEQILYSIDKYKVSENININS